MCLLIATELNHSVAAAAAGGGVIGERAGDQSDDPGVVIDRPAAAAEAGTAIGAAGTAVLTTDERQIHEGALDAGIDREKTHPTATTDGHGLAGSVQSGILRDDNRIGQRNRVRAATLEGIRPAAVTEGKAQAGFAAIDTVCCLRRR